MILTSERRMKVKRKFEIVINFPEDTTEEFIKEFEAKLKLGQIELKVKSQPKRKETFISVKSQNSNPKAVMKTLDWADFKF